MAKKSSILKENDIIKEKRIKIKTNTNKRQSKTYDRKLVSGVSN